MQEALDMTSEEMDMAAHQLLLQERSRQLGGTNTGTVQSTNNNNLSQQQQQSPNNIHPTKSTSNSNTYSKL